MAEQSLEADIDFLLVFSPKREASGNAQFSAPTMPKVIDGLDSASLKATVAIYAKVVVRVVPVSSPEVAEACKILENRYRATNNTPATELNSIDLNTTTSMHGTIDSANSKPFELQAFYPRPGLGGHRIPIDPFYLTWIARKPGLNPGFIELAGEVNKSMPG